MTRIFIRRIIGGAILGAGFLLLDNEIGTKGCLGVFLVSAGIMVVSGYMKGFLTASQELKAKQEEKITAT